MTTFRTVALPLFLGIALAIIARGAVRIYSIPSSSMEPTLQVGDHIVVTPYHGALPRRGDVVVFRAPSEPGELFVKRIVAAPGDLVESRGGRLVICGHAVAEPYILHAATTGDIAPQVIPRDSYFVLGDNRGDSFDSRAWGILPRPLIVGRARFVLWSSRIGAPTRAASASAPKERTPSTPAFFRFSRFLEPIR